MRVLPNSVNVRMRDENGSASNEMIILATIVVCIAALVINPVRTEASMLASEIGTSAESALKLIEYRNDSNGSQHGSTSPTHGHAGIYR